MSEDEIDVLKTSGQLTPENRAALLNYVKAVYAAEKNGSALPGPPMEGTMDSPASKPRSFRGYSSRAFSHDIKRKPRQLGARETE